MKGLDGWSVWLTNFGQWHHLLLPLQSEPVHHKDLGSQEKASHLALVQSNTQEVQSASPVHGRAGDVEREASDRSIHEDSKIVTQIGASHTESPHARQDQDRANGEQNTTDEGLVYRSVEWLLVEGDLVDMITQNAQREDGKGQEVASSVRTAENASQDVVVVLCLRPVLAASQKYGVLTRGTRRTCAGNDAVKHKTSVNDTHREIKTVKFLLPEDRVECNGRRGHCWSQLQSHARCGESTRLSKVNIQANDEAEKSTKSVRLAMVQNPGVVRDEGGRAEEGNWGEEEVVDRRSLSKQK